jgi:nucleotide-binding universal stress UspA family protein
MTYELSVCVNDICNRPYAAHAALGFAAQENAHLTAVYIKLEDVQIRGWIDSSPYQLANKMLEAEVKQESEAKLQFESIAKSYACKTTWKVINQSDDPFKQMICTDFIFAAQPINDILFRRPDDHFITDLLLRTKRPIILIPNGWKQQHIGENILVGWNDSTVAMRAVADAMPLLKSAKQVNVLKIVKHNFFSPKDAAYPDIKSYLNNKGVSNTLLIQSDDKNLGEHQELINFAKGDESDLIVIGGYSHSRFREVLFGGVTKHLITQSLVPVLISH